jgi:hypothetical protein
MCSGMRTRMGLRAWHGSRVWRPRADGVAEPAELPDCDHDEADGGGGGESTNQRQLAEQPSHPDTGTTRTERDWCGSLDLLSVFIHVGVTVEPEVFGVLAQEASSVRPGG